MIVGTEMSLKAKMHRHPSQRFTRNSWASHTSGVCCYYIEEYRPQKTFESVLGGNENMGCSIIHVVQAPLENIQVEKM